MLDIQTETDVTSVLNSYAARQPDSDRFRLWEVAGTAHADAHLIGRERQVHRLRRADQRRPDAPRRQGGAARARRLDRRPARPRPTAPRLDVTPGAAPQIRRDADGIALGGIRTPPVDVPVVTLVGRAGPEPVDDLPARRLDQAASRRRGSRSSIRHAPRTFGRTTRTRTRRSRRASCSPKIVPRSMEYADPSRITE